MLLVAGHTSYTNIQTCLAALTGQHVSIGTIAAVAQAAQQRACVDVYPRARLSTHSGVG